MSLLPGLFCCLILTISDVTPQVINSAEDAVTIFASASGLSNTTQYLQAVFTKEGAPTNYLGLTKNIKDEWYPYKSSPTTSDLSGYFYSLSPVSSTWSGQIQAKIDTADDGFLGPGNYVLKLFKYISSSGTASNNSANLTVNIATPSSQASASAEAEVSAPEIGLGLGSTYNLGEIFGVDVSLSHFDPDTEFYLKIRGGTDETSLTKVQTRNGDAYYGDTETWAKFPQIKTDTTGHWSGQIQAVVPEDKSDGNYKIRLRVHRKDADTSLDSVLKEALFKKPPTIEELPTPSVASVTSFLVEVTSEKDDGEASQTAVVLDLPEEILGESTAASSPTTRQATGGEPLPLILAGGASLGLAFLYNTLRLWIKRIST